MKEYSKDQLIKLLIDNNLIVEGSKDVYSISTALAKNIKLEVKSKRCINYPNKFALISDTQVYNMVMDMCELDLEKYNNSGGSYYIRTSSKAAIQTLKRILATPEIDFKIFVETTKSAYLGKTVLPGFDKYLVNNLWEQVYNGRKQQETEKSGDRKGVI
jgi:hypothetical protein